MTQPAIVLASTSRYRALLLRRLLAHFEQLAPTADEASVPGETPPARAARLATAKAAAVAANHSEVLVIGSDQVAALGRLILHKPGSIENAREQLLASSGQVVEFYTSVCVIDTRTGDPRNALDQTRVHFRRLTEGEIDRYLTRERPIDCAGGFKSEGAGIALIERIETVDPTALVGLPLIALARLLRDAGLSLP